MFGSLSGSVEYIRTANGIEVPVPDHVLPQAVELRDQVAAVLLGCGRESAVAALWNDDDSTHVPWLKAELAKELAVGPLEQEV